MNQNEPAQVDMMLSAGWCILPKRIIFDHSLTDKEKIFYAFLSSYTAQRGYAWASNEYLAQQFHCSTRTITRTINSLKRHGYFKVILLRDRITDEVKQRRIYLSSPNASDVATPYRQICPGVSTNLATPTDKNGEYNNKRVIKKGEEGDQPPPFSKNHHKKLFEIVKEIFKDTDPDLQKPTQRIMNVVHEMFQKYTPEQIAAAHKIQRYDPKRAQKAEIGFDWLFDANWSGRYADERIERYLAQYEKKRKVAEYRKEQRKKRREQNTHETTPEELEAYKKRMEELKQQLIRNKSKALT